MSNSTPFGSVKLQPEDVRKLADSLVEVFAATERAVVGHKAAVRERQHKRQAAKAGERGSFTKPNKTDRAKPQGGCATREF